MSHRIKIYFGLVLICLLWGSSWAAVKLGLETIPPLLSLGIRFTIASMILGVIAVFQQLGISRSTAFWKLAAIISMTSFTVPFVLIYWAQLQINSSLAAVLFATYPFWVAILSHFYLPAEKITVSRILGMIIGFAGVAFIFSDGFRDVNSTTLFGMVALVAGAVIQAIGLISIRRSGEHFHPVALNLWPMAMSSLPLFAASIAWEDYSKIVYDQQSVGSLLYLALFCTATTFVIYFWLIKHIEVVILSLSAFITPMIAVIIGVFLLGEEFTGTMIIGSILVLLGVAVATLDNLVALYRR